MWHKSYLLQGLTSNVENPLYCWHCGWTRDLVSSVFNYTLCNCFGYAIASFIGYSRLCRKLGKFSNKTVPQCHLTENQPSLTHNLRIACTILVFSAAILLVSAPDGVDCSSGNTNGPRQKINRDHGKLLSILKPWLAWFTWQEEFIQTSECS